MRMATPNYRGGDTGAELVMLSLRLCSSRRDEAQNSKKRSMSPINGARDVSARSTSNYAVVRRISRSFARFMAAAGRDVPRSVHGHALTTVMLSTLAGLSAAADISPRECETRARQEYSRAGAAHTNHVKDVKAAWEFARACFDVGEFATNSNERAEIAERGISL